MRWPARACVLRRNDRLSGAEGLEICSLQDDGMYKNTWKDNADQLAAAADVFQFYKDCIDSGVVDPNSKSFGYEETGRQLRTTASPLAT